MAIESGLLPDSARTFVFARGTIGNTSFVAIPFLLPLPQVLGILRERGELAFERRAPEQLPAALELAPQLLLRLRQPLQGLAN